jgi:hypothetical protein
MVVKKPLENTPDAVNTKSYNTDEDERTDEQNA